MKNKRLIVYFEAISIFIMILGMLLMHEDVNLVQNLFGAINLLLGIIWYIYWRTF